PQTPLQAAAAGVDATAAGHAGGRGLPAAVVIGCRGRKLVGEVFMVGWKVAGVQMDCRLGDRQHNLRVMRERLRDAAGRGAGLGGCPGSAVCGYCYESRGEAWPHAEPLPGPSAEALADDCRRLGAWAIFGLLERDEASGRLFNACALVGLSGLAATYRKIHL